MSAYVAKDPLEKSELWKLANDIAGHVYSKLPELPEEEKWHTESDLRGNATDTLYYLAQALGTGTPGGAEYDFGNARKYASSLKGIYRFASRQHFFELEPEVMVKINRLIALIDEELTNAHKLTEAVNEAELEQWRTKYKLWKDMT
jgi:hypothetical protein